MSATTTAFAQEKAPCGKVTDGEQYRDADDEGLVAVHIHYTCGCRIIRHEYHDGSVCSRVVRHDGRILADELAAESWH